MFVGNYTVGIYVFKVNNGNARAMYEICLKLTVQTPERLQSRRSAVFVINVRHILHTVRFCWELETLPRGQIPVVGQH